MLDLAVSSTIDHLRAWVSSLDQTAQVIIARMGVPAVLLLYRKDRDVPLWTGLRTAGCHLALVRRVFERRPDIRLIAFDRATYRYWLGAGDVPPPRRCGGRNGRDCHGRAHSMRRILEEPMMPFSSSIPGNAVTEALLAGRPLTSLEAILCFGFADMAKRASRLRVRGFPIRARQVALKVVLARLEEALGAPVPAHACALELGGGLTEYFVPVEFIDAPGGMRAAGKAQAEAEAG
jgi:hypothetical protein